jgi:hypothetical protein
MAAGGVRASEITSTWSGNTGNWTDPTQWSTNPNYPNNGTPSGTTYDAVINAPGTGAYTVMLNSNITTDSVTLDSPNATLSQTGGTLTTTSLNISAGTYSLNGGVLQNATYDNTGGTLAIPGSGSATFSNVSLGSDLTFNGSGAQPQKTTLYIDNGLSANGNTINLANEANLTFQLNSSTYTLNNVTVNLGSGGSGGGNLSAIQNTLSTLVLGTSAAVNGYGGVGTGPGAYALTNQGTITADISGQTLKVEPDYLLNSGTIKATKGGTINVVTNMDNTNGTVEADSGSTVIYNSVNVFSPLADTTTSQLGNFVNNGGTITLAGILNNAGNTLTFGGPTGTWVLSSIVQNGVVNLPPTTILVDPQFEGGTLACDLTESLDYGEIAIDNLTVAGHQTINITGNAASLSVGAGLDASETLSDVTVNLGGNTNNALGGFLFLGPLGIALTLDTTTTVNGWGDIGVEANGTGMNPAVVNEGIVTANVSGKTLAISSTTLTNTGTLQATRLCLTDREHVDI